MNECTHGGGIPRLGDTASDFTQATTHGENTFSKWQKPDHWVVLFSHPADFTPVCTTERAELQRRKKELDDRKTNSSDCSSTASSRTLPGERTCARSSAWRSGTP